MSLASAHITSEPLGTLQVRPVGDPARTVAPGESALATGPAEAAFRSLLKTLGLLKRVMEPSFSRFGISSSQWGVLATLHRCETDEGRTALRLTDLGDRLIIRPPSVTGVVGRLQRMGLVARTASPDDHRAKDVRLTAAGRELIHRVLEHHPARVQSAFEGLTAAEQSEFRRLLDRLSAHLECGVIDPTETAAQRRHAGNAKVRRAREPKS